MPFHFTSVRVRCRTPNAWIVVFGAALISSNVAAASQSLPSYMDIAVAAGQPKTKAQIASRNVTALDNGMQQIYAKSLAIYKENIRAELPVIVARFDDWGGSMTLYPPGKDPIKAPPVPQIYALVKSVSHSSMAMYQLVAPYLKNPDDMSWKGSMAVYLAQIRTAREALSDLQLPDDVRTRLGSMLDKEIAFME